jgi:TolB protein
MGLTMRNREYLGKNSRKEQVASKTIAQKVLPHAFYALLTVAPVYGLAHVDKKEPVNPPPAKQPDGSPTQSEQETKSYKDCKIVFASRDRVACEVYIMNPDGSQQKRLTDLTNSGAFYGSRTRHSCSPDGKRIAFETRSSHVRPFHHIFIMNVDGSGQVCLPGTRDSDNRAHSWSPAGKEIAFFRGTDGPAIYRVNADGTGPKRLTDIPVCPTVPSWSPDGNKIAFASRREANCAICVINADGTERKRLTDYHHGTISWSWSPDGRKIAYMLDGLSRGPSKGLYVMNADGTEQRKLADSHSTGDLTPSLAWSPDGKSIAFMIREGRKGEICTVHIDGSGIRNLTKNPTHDAFPSWSPDGKKIAFASDRDGNSEIYLMNPDGTQQKRLTNSPRTDFDPCWLPTPEPDT